MIEFDETTNSESKKELQIRICFQSEKMNQVVERHLKTCFLGHATAEDLKSEILNAIDGSSLSLSKLLTLSSDSQNVNKKPFRLMDSEKHNVTNCDGLKRHWHL